MRPRDGRHAPIASRLTGLDPATATGLLIGRDIVLDWAPEIEATRAGVALVRTTGNLVVRFCPQLRLRPATALAEDLARQLVAIDHDAVPKRTPGRDALVVHLGGGREADVTGSAEGWVAHVSGHGQALPALHDSDVVVGAHGAAALVASQVFARALPLNPDIAGPSATTVYSLFEYGTPTNPPPTVGGIRIERALLAGAGAVGQACVDVLVDSGATGQMDVVDRGHVDDITNLNRSILALQSDLEAETPKVDLAFRRAVGAPLVIVPHQGTLESVIDSIRNGELVWPQIGLSALDNRDARLALQGLWPDLVLEGATGDTMAQVFRHEHGEATACLRCLHREDGAGENYVAAMARLTGLDRARISTALAGDSEVITERDIAAATPEARELVAASVGRDVCGFLVEVERYLGRQAEPVQLSVAFTSYLAGTFLAGELIKEAAGLESPLVGRYQIDPLATLHPDAAFAQQPSPDCLCQTRPEIVAEVRRVAAEMTEKARQ